MPERKNNSGKKRSRNGRRREEPYTHRANAVNMTVYDLYGNQLPNAIVAQIINEVNDSAEKHGFGFSFTRV